MKIYTRTGDQGETGLFGGGRLSKSHPRIEATGAVDELNAVLGRALLSIEEPRIRQRILLLQDDLFSLGGFLTSAPRPDADPHPHLPELPRDRPEEMEGWIDEISAELEPLENFILPGGSPGAAELHVARTVCRRVERRIVALSSDATVDSDILRFFNRLSDLLFTFARLENRYQGVEESVWRGS